MHLMSSSSEHDFKAVVSINFSHWNPWKPDPGTSSPCGALALPQDAAPPSSCSKPRLFLCLVLCSQPACVGRMGVEDPPSHYCFWVLTLVSFLQASPSVVTTVLPHPPSSQITLTELTVPLYIRPFPASTALGDLTTTSNILTSRSPLLP